MASRESTALGLDSGVVRLVPYDPRWAELFVEERERILAIAESAHVSIVLEHTGSTAIRGMIAKPVLDILAGRSPSTSRETAIDVLRRVGYLYRGEQGIPGRDFFRRGDPRQYHVHLAEIGSTFWDDHRLFRDFLREQPEEAAAYAALKRDLAEQYPFDRESYINGKTEFVRAVLVKARQSSALRGFVGESRVDR
jgi:GrpB-like predicted nucleotidyltransferase (UPF0157 family)